MILLPLWILLAAPQEEIPAALKKFIDVYSVVEAESADAIDSRAALYGGALPGMLRGLDPHSIFLDPDQFQQLQEMSRAEQKGFGSIVSLLPGRVIVLQTLPGTPSARAGLSPGDEIVAVNGYVLANFAPEQLAQLLGESRRQQARITVRRSNTPRLLDFVLTPETVSSPSVDRAFQLRPGTGYIRIQNFEVRTAAELRKAIDSLGGDQLGGLVLDLRGNPGGVIEPALECAAMFLQPGQRILYVRGRSKREEEIRVPDGGPRYKFGVSVLIDEKTASAAEIVAAALQENKRGRVAGQRSFGKGLVQTVFPLSDKAGLALTVAFYYSPNGRNIQRPLKDVQLATDAADRGGVIPDAVVTPEGFTRLRAALDGSGAFTTFTTEFLRKGASVDASFEVTGPLLDEYRSWLVGRKIQPAVPEWSADLPWIRSRLKQEIFNQSLGVAKGDEVEAARDRAVQTALDLLSGG